MSIGKYIYGTIIEQVVDDEIVTHKEDIRDEYGEIEKVDFHDANFFAHMNNKNHENYKNIESIINKETI